MTSLIMIFVIYVVGGPQEWSPVELCCCMTKTRSHRTANFISATLVQMGWEVINHPPCSPDPTPCHFHLFGPLKKHLGENKVGSWWGSEDQCPKVAACPFQRLLWFTPIEVYLLQQFQYIYSTGIPRFMSRMCSWKLWLKSKCLKSNHFFFP